jgi:LysM repeat protein
VKRFRPLRIIGLLLLLLVAAVPVDAGQSQSIAAQSTIVHVVSPGENLFRISLRYGTSVAAVKAANNLVFDTIYVGQQLIIPGETEAVSQWSESSAGNGTHLVQPGDTLSSIAQRYGTSVSELVAANGIVNASRIYAGQVLRLSGTESVVPGSGAKQIVVNLSQQRLYAYQGDQLVYDFVISSGTAPYYTRTGTFQVQSKFPNAYGSAWNIWMPYWMGIYWAGSSENGIHALPVLSNGQTLWAGYLGRPVSYGCVVVGTYEAKLLFDWTPLGTPVQITY